VVFICTGIGDWPVSFAGENAASVWERRTYGDEDVIVTAAITRDDIDDKDATIGRVLFRTRDIYK
jgi:hypothetical protein